MIFTVQNPEAQMMTSMLKKKGRAEIERRSGGSAWTYTLDSDLVAYILSSG